MHMILTLEMYKVMYHIMVILCFVHSKTDSSVTIAMGVVIGVLVVVIIVLVVLGVCKLQRDNGKLCYYFGTDVYDFTAIGLVGA